MGKQNFRPMQYDCQTDGCFNVRHRLDFSQWYDALPGNISFSDLDGITEVAGNFLVLEWKSHASPLPTGQKIMFERMTRSSPFTVFCMAGPKNDPVKGSIFYGGKWHGWKDVNDKQLLDLIARWAKWALGNPRFR